MPWVRVAARCVRHVGEVLDAGVRSERRERCSLRLGSGALLLLSFLSVSLALVDLVGRLRSQLSGCALLAGGSSYLVAFADSMLPGSVAPLLSVGGGIALRISRLPFFCVSIGGAVSHFALCASLGIVFCSLLSWWRFVLYVGRFDGGRVGAGLVGRVMAVHLIRRARFCAYSALLFGAFCFGHLLANSACRFLCASLILGNVSLFLTWCTVASH